MSSSFKLQKEGRWLEANNIKFEGYNFLPDEEIISNNRANLELIDEWVRPIKCHSGIMILVSGGYTTGFPENIAKIKELIAQAPNQTKVLCVKHAFPILVENGIIPWGCVILDTRPLDEISSLGKHRMELLQKATPETLFFALTRVHPSYTFFLQKKKIRVIGFHNHIDEFALSMGFKNGNDLKNNGTVFYEEFCRSWSALPGSCAALCAINLAIFFGYRDLHLFGYDSCVKSPDDTKDECFTVETNGKSYYVPKEFVSIGMEFERMFKIYPRELNVQFQHYSPDTFIGGIFINCAPLKLVPWDPSMKYKSIKDKGIKGDTENKEYNNGNTGDTNLTLTKSDRLNQRITEIQGGYFNQPYYRRNRIVRGFKNYEDYVKLQSYSNKHQSHLVFANESFIKILCKKLLELRMKSSVESANKTYLPIQNGICHGIRHGQECVWFREGLGNVKIFGTEISKNVIKCVDSRIECFEMDFHIIRGEWINSIDFIYTNSFEHTYDPVGCLTLWSQCLHPSGIILIEWVPTFEASANHLEPFGADFDGYKEIFIEAGLNLVEVVKLGDAPLTDRNDGFKPASEKIARICFVLMKTAEK